MAAILTPATPATPDVQPLPAQRSRGYWSSVLLRLRRDPVAMAAAAVVLLLVVLAIAGPWIAPADPYASSMFKRLKPIGTPGLPLGSDELGRDLLSRLIVGTRLSLFMGITPVLCAFAIGADYAMSARAFMFAIGCIQSRSCHSNHCPTGVATQDPLRQRAAEPPLGDSHVVPIELEAPVAGQ